MSSNAFAQPGRHAVDSALSTLLHDLRPVRRFPSDLILAGMAAVLFLALSMGLAAALGWHGWRQLSNAQRLLYGGSVLGSALLLAIDLAPQMIPAAKRRFSFPVAFAVPLIAVTACARVLFPASDLSNFVPRGIPCLRTALLCAAGGGAFAWFLLLRGYLVNPLRTSVSTALFASFAGIAVLALHCPQQNWLHVVVWHLGAPVISALAVWAYWKLKIVYDRP